mmetsp:Transcript_24586/g.52979  ORF Transcript_24586/g.52979 Transcript_24586/m.52979 type:complete len:210 (+) Transcript_24586:165-794(+)|eukprot:CAMPEP_0172300414 /NCGR_PEP_ID=MMETSP1058-20130122/2515_1 /TAXON_ID=83371 /ORGANISM="Detonula confervacea, Strain CCMP 353" /LENGTH=209 /DNA_ID=CAMNT_0013010189 /DNA_START=108 /DNA_END=737 /DNA_ORIENTATION=-
MKATSILTAVATAAALTLPHAGALSKVSSQRVLSDEEQRELLHYTVIFEECVGMHIDDCKADIAAAVTAAFESGSDLFEGRESLAFQDMHARTSSSEGYYMVGLRTNQAEDKVIGVLGDGMIFYPWDWCHSEYDCYNIGPWDCDVGTPLGVEECCNMIKATVTHPDLNGNYLECHVDPPVGSVSNPTNYGRVCIRVNDASIVTHPPKNE